MRPHAMPSRQRSRISSASSGAGAAGASGSGFWAVSSDGASASDSGAAPSVEHATANAVTMMAASNSQKLIGLPSALAIAKGVIGATVFCNPSRM